MKTSIATMLVAGVLGANLVMMPGAFAETVTFKADLSGSNEVPPNDSTATGTAEASFDTETKQFTATATFEGLSGPAAGAHLHGPVGPSENAGIVLPFDSALSPIEVSATLTDPQAEALMAGLWYVNVHTELHPGGEIRGQLTR